MSFFLCHHCYTWVQPQLDRCPECQSGLDASTEDPSPRELQTIIGEIRRPLGEVRVKRSLLPDLGMLYATQNGLFFAPHATEYIERNVPADATADSLFWMIGSVVWAPLSILLPILRMRSRETQTVRVPVLKPRYLPLNDPESPPMLPDLLMSDPGAFFLSQQFVHRLRRRRGWWIIDRQLAPPVFIRSLDGRPAFHQRMQELIDRDGWRE